MLYKNKGMRAGILLNTAKCLEICWITKIFPDIEFHDWKQINPQSFIKLCRENNVYPIIVRGDYSSIEFAKITQFFCKNKITFETIHLSDEYGSDDLSWYRLEYCSKIYRNYIFPRSIAEFPTKEKVSIMPLGPLIYNSTESSGPALKDRKYAWSFAGRTNTTYRPWMFDDLKKYEPYDLYLFGDFMDSSKKSGEEYAKMLKESKIIPILPGANLETFRLYEALEFGAIPLYTRVEGDELYFTFLRKLFPDILNIQTPAELFELHPDKLEEYRNKLFKSWENVKRSPFISLVDLAIE